MSEGREKIFGVRTGGAPFLEVCFVESKLRGSADTGAPVEGYEQLRRDYEKELPDILQFLAARLQERNDPLYGDFMIYLRDRRDLASLDTFRLGLLWERDEWSETCLHNLEEYLENSGPPPVSVHVVVISGLINLVEELYGRLGLDVERGQRASVR